MSSPSGTARAPGAAARDADLSARAADVAGELERALAEGRLDVLEPEAVQRLIAALCRTYSAQNEAGDVYLPLPEQSQVMDTDVMVLASALLKAVNLQVFELGMWQSWTGR
jgi:hypothetical protein